MGYYEAPDEVEYVRDSSMGVEDTQKWQDEEEEISRWFNDNPRFESGPRVA